MNNHTWVVRVLIVRTAKLRELGGQLSIVGNFLSLGQTGSPRYRLQILNQTDRSVRFSWFNSQQ